MNIEKIHKYTYKYINNPKQIYINKLNFYGGQRYNVDNFNSIMEYVREKLSSTIANKKTKDTYAPNTEKHLIMLYGPPASGKTKAKEIILNKLNIANDNYIDINLDDIIGDDKTYITTISDLKRRASDPNTGISQDIKDEATDIYFSIRNKANIVFELLLFITRLYNISLVVEVTGGTYCSMIWWYNILSFYKSKEYKITLIYPVISNSTTIINRAEGRAKEIFRFVSSNSIEKSIENAKKNIKTIIEDKDKNNIFDSIYIYYNDNELLFNTPVKNNKFNQLFNDNIIYIKEYGEINPEINNTFMKEINDDIDKVFINNTTDKPYKPESCNLTY